MRASVAAGRIVDQPSEDTLSDGSAGGVVHCFVPILCYGTPSCRQKQQSSDLWWRLEPVDIQDLDARCMMCGGRQQTGSSDAMFTTVDAQEPGSLTFEPCRRFVDDWVTATEPEIAAAMLGVRRHHDGMLLEGVLPLLCRYFGCQGTPQRHVLGTRRCIVTH